jgi:hypothetical protein
MNHARNIAEAAAYEHARNIAEAAYEPCKEHGRSSI